jgi:hypothetical protein
MILRYFSPAVFRSVLGFLGIALMASCGVRFVPMALEDPYAKLQDRPDFPDFKARMVYSNTTGDEVWGPEACGELGFEKEEAYEGNAIRIQWNKEKTCDWTGMGIGWDAWSGKDLSGIMDEAAFQFQFRSTKGESRVPIMILLLEDYAGGMCAAPLRAGYMESYPLNEEWRTVTVPLSDFNYKDEGTDMTNIKQLIFELQGAGDVLLDDINIVPMPKSESGPMASTRPSLIPLGKLPIPLFEGSMPNGWGLEKNDYRDFKLTGKGLEMVWTAQGPWSPMGFSWTRWLAVDLDASMNQAAIEIEANIHEGSGEVLVGLQDYNYNKAVVTLQDYKRGDGRYLIPLSTLPFTKSGTDPRNIKCFYLDVKGSGSATISRVRMVEVVDG